MRLIDADELRKQLSTMCPLYATDEYDYCTKDILDKVDDLVQKQPTAYDVDKVVEQLEQQKNQYFRRSDEIKNRFGENFENHRLFSKACSYDNAIQIVKSGGIE